MITTLVLLSLSISRKVGLIHSCNPIVLAPIVLDPIVLDPIVLDLIVLDPIVLDPIGLYPIMIVGFDQFKFRKFNHNFICFL